MDQIRLRAATAAEDLLCEADGSEFVVCTAILARHGPAVAVLVPCGVRETITEIGDGFWNLRGSLRIFGLLQIGTHTSLVRLDDGRFVLLDAYTLPPDLLDEVRGLTDGGRAIAAILNLHPFHTLHVERVHAQFPEARLYGSSRHVERAPNLKWQSLRVDDSNLEGSFPGLEFSVPQGVDFISDDHNVHFSSVLAFHRRSNTLHVDDTLNFTHLPFIGGVGFHPTLSRALSRTPGAAERFSTWATQLAERWSDTTTLCAAHSAVLTGISDFPGLIRDALARVQKTLRKHEQKFG